MDYSFKENIPIMIDMKGIHDCLLISFSEGQWEAIKESLFNRVAEQEKFFEGAKIALDVGVHEIHAAELGNLRDILSEKRITLRAVISESSITQQSAQMLGIETVLRTSKEDRNISSNKNIDGENALYLHKTLRSGTKITYNGSVVVVGDINPGAEIIAAGSIIVWGKISGVVHAGAEGDASAVVCSLDLNPTQLRIAGLIAISPKRKGKPFPETAKILDGMVVAEAWKKKIGGK